MRASTVGSIAVPNPGGGNFAIGRTGTHEVGHYLNLIHIWGDGACNASDLVSDTPTAAAANDNSAPCTYPGPDSCDDGAGDLSDMFQNYMDYSDDVCMNLFTAGQKARMQVAIMVSRPGLITAACGATPVNDLLANAISINCSTATYSGSTATATSSDTPADCITSISAPGVWYKMTGMHADVTLDLCQAPYDSKMNIYEDDGNGGLICITGEDDDFSNCVGNDPYITFASEIGKTYFVYIQGFSGQTGAFTMNVSCDCYNNVVNSDDSGPGSLRGVIACADAGDVITFDPSTNGQNIMLSTGQIVINKDLTILGNGMDNTIVDGAMDDASRIFDIPSGGAAGSLAIRIEALTIQNGGSLTASGIQGAAINNHHQLSILDVKIKDNKVTGSRTSGINIWAGSLSATNCFFEGNITDNPSNGKGTIWAQGNSSVFINQCLFINNSGNNLIYGLNTSFFELINNTTYNNSMISHIFAVEAGEVHIDNNIISESGSAQYLGGGLTTSTITNNLSGAADPQLLASDNNIFGDPLFVDAAGGDFNLALNSPCFNTGNPAQVPLDILDIDGDNNTTEPIPVDLSGTRIRVINGTVDMGAYERIPEGCEDVYPIECGVPITEDIAGYSLDYTCSSFSFEVKIHEYTASSSGPVTIDLYNFSGDKFLYLLDDSFCGSNGCNYLTFSESSGSIAHQVTFDLISGNTYYIMVWDYSENQGMSGSGGTYDLSLTCGPDCASDLVFVSPTDDISSGTMTQSTDENITSDIMISGASTEVIYSAGNAAGKSIQLEDGFTVELGAAFQANLDGCLTAPPVQAPSTNQNKETDQSKNKARN